MRASALLVARDSRDSISPPPLAGTKKLLNFGSSFVSARVGPEH